MLLLAVKTSWVRKFFGEKMEDFEKLLTLGLLVSANGIQSLTT